MINTTTNIAEKRPVTDVYTNTADMKKFSDFIRYGSFSNDSENTLNTSFVPRDIFSDIEEKIKQRSPLKSLANIRYTSSDKLDVVLDKGKANLSGWVKNNELLGDNESSVMKRTIELHELFARPKVTQRLLDDQNACVEDFVKEKIITHMASAENLAFLKGDGISQPKGILSYDFSYDKSEFGKIEAVKTGSFENVGGYDCLVKLVEKLPSEYLSNAVWIMSRNAVSMIRNLRDETTKRFAWQVSLLSGTPDTLLGYPVIVCDDMDKPCSDKASTPVLFGNFYEGYQIAEKPEIKILKDPYNSKPFIEFYATKAIGGDVVNFDAIKALRCVQ